MLAQRAVWLRLQPMPATWRVRSRSTAAAGAVHVRARAMACRSGADSDTGGGHGLGPPSRRARPAIRGGGDGAAIGHQDAPARAKGRRAPPANSARGRASGGSKGGGAPLAVDRPRIGPQRLGPASGSRRSRARYPAQSFISRRRRSNRSVRRYAASTRLRTLCASAASATSGG